MHVSKHPRCPWGGRAGPCIAASEVYDKLDPRVRGSLRGHAAASQAAPVSVPPTSPSQTRTFARSVPEMPMDNPTSASLSAGASLAPLPNTATTCAMRQGRVACAAHSEQTCGLHARRMTATPIVAVPLVRAARTSLISLRRWTMTSLSCWLHRAITCGPRRSEGKGADILHAAPVQRAIIDQPKRRHTLSASPSPAELCDAFPPQTRVACSSPLA
jgi:hypothetical protein